MTEHKSSIGWTLDTLEKHLSDRLTQQDDRNRERFQAAKEQVSTALQASDKALTKAEAASDKRFDAVNEFRSALSDQSKDMMRRSDFEIQHNGMIEKVGGLTTRIATIEAAKIGKAEGFGNLYSMIAICISVLAVLATYFRH